MTVILCYKIHQQRLCAPVHVFRQCCVFYRVCRPKIINKLEIICFFELENIRLERIKMLALMRRRKHIRCARRLAIRNEGRIIHACYRKKVSKVSLNVVKLIFADFTNNELLLGRIVYHYQFLSCN